MKLSLFPGLALLFGLTTISLAGSATWNLNPTDNLWNTAENWTPATVPNSETDVATFGASSVTDVAIGLSTTLQGAENKVDSIVFSSGASAYTLTSTASQSPTYYSGFLEFYGAGIVNNSGRTQNFIAQATPGLDGNENGSIFFNNSSSAGENVVITNQGSASNIGDGAYGGWTRFALQFADTPGAGNATFINEGGKVSGTIYGGTTDLYSYATAAAATFINQPGVVDGAAAGHTFLYTGGNIGTSTFINSPATVTGAEGGWTELDIGICAGCSFTANGSTSAGPQAGQVYAYGGAGNATFTANGGQGSGAQGGLIEIHNMPNSSQTVVIAKGGSNGGLGGMITINGLPSSLDQVQFQLLGNGTMDLSGLLQNSATIGSLSGKGTITLAGFLLNVGSNNLSTTYSGVIQDGGAIGKVGTGTLTITAANSYTSGTNVNAGTLIVGNRSGSATGTGLVKVTGGTLGGSGTIGGTVRIGTGTGTGAFLEPSAGSNRPSALTIQGALTFKTDSSCIYKLNSRKAQADLVLANGVTIESGAQFAFSAIGNKKLTAGATFTAISNTAATPISGAFANLADGSTVTVGRNNYQVSYSGGDCNDLTLTVVP